MSDENPSSRELRSISTSLERLHTEHRELRGAVDQQGKMLSAVNARTEALQNVYERDLDDMRERVTQVDRIARNRSLVGGAATGGGLWLTLEVVWQWVRTKFGA